MPKRVNELQKDEIKTFVAQLSPSYFPIVGGEEIYVRALALELRNYDIMSEVITLCDTRKWESSKRLKRKTLDNLPVTVWPSYPTWKLSLLTEVHYLPFPLAQLRRYLKEFDLLHFHDEGDLSLPLSASRIKKPRIISCHSLAYTVNFYFEHTLARRLFTSCADLFHVFSTVDEKNLMRLGVQKNRVRIIPSGIDVASFNCKEKLTRDKVRIVTLGRLQRTKGIIVLLKAFNLLRKNCQNVELLIGGKVWEPEYYRELVEYRKAANLEEVRFTGFVNDSASFLLQADIFVLPSLEETFGGVNMEAMAACLPIVASSVGGIPEYVIDNQTGFLVPPGDPIMLAKKLEILVADAKLRRKMGSKGRERAESLYSIDKATESVMKMYRELT
jgi:glycosyltransferase involved in cell wall biosynthesis